MQSLSILIPRSPAYFFYAIGLAAAVFGAAALTVWHSGATPFYSIQRVPYGTSVGLLLYGIAVVALGLRRNALASVFGSALIALAGLRLIEYFSQSNLELKIFFSHYGVASEPHRTGVLTALSFVLLGTALITLARKNRGKPALIAVSLIATAVLAISLTTLVGSMSEHYGAYDWLQFDRLQIPTALLLLVLSASLIALAFFAQEEHGISITRWAPVAVGFGIFVGALHLWQALVVWEARQIQQDISRAASGAGSYLRSSVEEQVRILERLASRWEIYEPTEQQWHADARKTLPGSYFTGVAWFDKNFQLRWTSQPDNKLGTPPRNDAPSFSEFLKLDSGQTGLRVHVPVLYQGVFDGVIVGTLPIRGLLRDILLAGQPGFSLALFDRDKLIISLNEENLAFAKRWGFEQPVALYNSEWTLRVAPTAEYLEASHHRLPEALLISGLLVAALLASAVFFYQSARSREIESGIANRRLARETEERRQASVALARSETRLSEIMEQARDSIISFDSEQKITRFNRAAEKTFDLAAADVLGQPISRLLSGTSMLQAFKLQQPREMTAARGDGTTFPAEVSMSQSGPGQELVYTAVLRDISERKKIERETKEALEYYFRLFTDFPTLVRRSDVSGQCDYCNEAWLKYTGRTREEELGEGWLRDIHPDDCGLTFQTFARALNSRAPFEMEYRLRRRDGQYGWVHDFGKPTHDPKGEFTGYLNACYDVSARKQAQFELERSRRQLRALSAHLQTAREEEKVTLARKLHDELGSKLTALKLDLGWLTTKLPQEPAVRNKAAAMSGALDTALNAMRRMWSELRPSVLDDLGFVAALKWEAREFRKLWRIPVLVMVEPEDAEAPPEIGLALYRILQEALANVAVHARASQVALSFRVTPDT
ncbi:MAG TPA: PAS domain S-box protein, partial [Burkholderiales bacterium]|nr:PAS domain S-box protein [Burkholderiales bacterium]